MTNQRKHPRVNVRVLASFDCYNEDGEIFNQQIGLILDISLGGMLIETDDTIEANYVEIVFVNHEHELMSIVGSIVHSRKSEDGKAKTGICFHGADSENVKIATNLIRAHYFGNKDSSSTTPKPADIPT